MELSRRIRQRHGGFLSKEGEREKGGGGGGGGEIGWVDQMVEDLAPIVTCLFILVGLVLVTANAIAVLSPVMRVSTGRCRFLGKLVKMFSIPLMLQLVSAAGLFTVSAIAGTERGKAGIKRKRIAFACFAVSSFASLLFAGIGAFELVMSSALQCSSEHIFPIVMLNIISNATVVGIPLVAFFTLVQSGSGSKIFQPSSTSKIHVPPLVNRDLL